MIGKFFILVIFFLISIKFSFAENLNFKKDTSILMIEEALKKEMKVFQCEINDLFVDNNDVLVNCREINSLSEDIDIEVKKIDIDLKDFKYCFMRKDPPVDEDYNNALHLLDLAKQNGAVIHNNPCALKKFNEKVFYINEDVLNISEKNLTKNKLMGRPLIKHS